LRVADASESIEKTEGSDLSSQWFMQRFQRKLCDVKSGGCLWV
jgi:hypothetical protein